MSEGEDPNTATASMRLLYTCKLREENLAEIVLVDGKQSLKELYCLLPPPGYEEIKYAAAAANWLSEGLQSELPENVEANLSKLALAGHSRGGKTAFSLALGYAKTTLGFSVLLGIDPVGGITKECQIAPKILTYVPRSFNLRIPVMVVGTGLGDEKRNCLLPPCAPDGVNHKEFFDECQPPCCYFVTRDYGHMDMLDDNPQGLLGKISDCRCKNGNGGREPMRRAVGGLVVAFLEAYLEGDNGDLKAIIDEPDIARVKLDPIEFIEA
ncbi:hypothetical protein HHK36_020577 [Tetracentron sinense]|uniref:Chlorophyllase n=1 Tax=Tetracentron sinense TaxID=13715 RepID=A0A835DBR4_TETSI|nr:hypothetical protein HHK36_020577 [Tetracentron sinense]